MNETRRDALWEELNDRARTLFDTATEDLLDGVEWIKSERYDMYTMLADQLTDEAIELVTRHRDAEIREALLDITGDAVRLAGEASKGVYDRHPHAGWDVIVNHGFFVALNAIGLAEEGAER